MGIRSVVAMGVLLASIAAPAGADTPVDERRTRDASATWNRDGFFNQFIVSLSGLGPEGIAPVGDLTTSVTDIEVTTWTTMPSGAVIERRYAAEVLAPEVGFGGRGGFEYGPVVYERDPEIYFKLPEVYGGYPTIVDIRLFLPEAEGDCLMRAYGPCGGSVAGYHNDGSLWLGIPSPTSWVDALDAVPEVLLLD